MTGKEWLASDGPEGMLKYLGVGASPRKLRLYAVACCRRLAGLLTESHRATLKVAERHATGSATADALAAAHAAALGGFGRYGGGNQTSAAVWSATLSDAWDAAWDAAWYARFAARDGLSANYEMERTQQARILQELFGNPFRRVALAPACLGWNGGTVVKMAQAIDEEGRFADLPILADALEDAGCADETLLAHCRGGGEHLRGCWAVDLLLGKR
jgi:hypothetical protein